jgi:hypothetical protein
VIAYGVCVGSLDKFNSYVLPHTGDYPVFPMFHQTSIAAAYNSILAMASERQPEMLILQHDDLEITDPEALVKLLEAVDEPDVALVGVAGATSIHGLDWWNAPDPIGHQLTDSMLIDFGPREGDVVSLEGSILAFSPWAIENLRFDLRFPGFHGYDEISMQAVHLGKRVVVRDVDTHHHTMVGFKSKASEEGWHMCNAMFREKWSL